MSSDSVLKKRLKNKKCKKGTRYIVYFVDIVNLFNDKLFSFSY